MWAICVNHTHIRIYVYFTHIYVYMCVQLIEIKRSTDKQPNKFLCKSYWDRLSFKNFIFYFYYYKVFNFWYHFVKQITWGKWQVTCYLHSKHKGVILLSFTQLKHGQNYQVVKLIKLTNDTNVITFSYESNKLRVVYNTVCTYGLTSVPLLSDLSYKSWIIFTI